MVAAAWSLRLWLWRPGLPLSLDGDSPFIAMQLREIRDHGWYWYNPDLGYPFGQNGALFPELNVIHVLAVKLLGLLASDPITPGVIYFIAGYGLAAATMYLLARSQRVARLPALVAGVLFACAPGHQERFEHLWLASYWVLPLGIWVALELLAGRPLLRTRRGANGLGARLQPRGIAVALSLTVVGLSGVYYVAFVLILLAVATVGRRWIGGAARDWLPGIGCMAYLAVVVSVPLVVARAAASDVVVTGRLPTTRSFPESELYAGKFMDLILPWSGHRLDVFAMLNFAYNSRGRPTAEIAAVGIVAAIGLVGLAVTGLRSLLTRQAVTDQRSHWAALSVVSFGAFTVGGLGAFIALFGTPQLRTWSRISLILMAFGLLAVGYWLTRAGGKWPERPTFAVSVAVLVVGLLDQTNPERAPDYSAIAQRLSASASYTNSLRQAVGEDCAVFQLPVVQFPEGTGLDPENPYEQLIPYLTSRDLRWSFGAMRGTRDAEWQLAVDLQDPGKMARELSALGFCAVEVNTRGFDSDTDPSDRLAAELGAPVARTADGTRVAYPLKAAMPTTTPRDRILEPVVVWLDAYSIRNDGSRVFQWIGPTATLRLVNLGSTEVPLSVSMTVTGAGDRERQVRVADDQGVLLGRADVRAGKGATMDLTIRAAPGVTLLDLELDGDTMRLSEPAITVSGQVSDLTVTSPTQTRVTTLQDQVRDGAVVLP